MKIKLTYYICPCGKKLFPKTTTSNCPFCGRVVVM